MAGTWRGSMLAALAATLGRPAWWAVALAAFLVRGGILLVLLPIVFLPTPAALATALAPTIEAFAFGGLTPERVVVVLAVGATLFVVVGGAGLAGAWLDGELLREAGRDEDLDLRWSPAPVAAADALTLRLAAHLPTLALLVYAAFRLVGAAYDELLSPGETTTFIGLRVVLRAPDAPLLLLAGWLLGEAVGGLAARRAARGERAHHALWRATRQVLGRRGLATLALTTAAVFGTLAAFLFTAARTWDLLRTALAGVPDAVNVGAALVVFCAWWSVGLAVVGAALAWRTMAWTAEVQPAAPAAATATEATA